MQRPPRSSPLRYVVALGFLVAGAWKVGVVAHDVVDQPQVTARRPAAAQARRREASAPGEPMRTVERRPVVATPLLLPPDAAGAASLPASIEDAPPADDAPRARELADGMQRLLRDLEYSAGLEEPPQQVIVRAPEPWRPDPRAEAAAAPEIDEVVPHSAPRGSVVKIRGKNLHATQVVFGHSPARILAGTGDEVTVEVPPGAGSDVAVAVTNSDGKYALARGKFAYAN